jgi:tetratricopeptide (TPR) repeat protein
MNGLVSVDRNQGKFVEILETQKRVLGTEHPDTLNSMNLVANEYLSQGKFTEAATLHAQLLEVRKRVLGPEHRDTLESMYEFGWVLIQQQKFADAELVLRQLLASRIKLTPNRWTTSVNRVRLGEALVGQGRFAEAEALLLQGQDEVKQHNLAADFPARLTTTAKAHGRFTAALGSFAAVFPDGATPSADKPGKPGALTRAAGAEQRRNPMIA